MADLVALLESNFAITRQWLENQNAQEMPLLATLTIVAALLSVLAVRAFRLRG
jgi:hypothetical protein